MKVKNDMAQCCGCGLCVEKCPKNAIKMTVAEDGFSYPEIDENKCIECNICRKICPFDIQKTAKNETVESYGFKTNIETREKSSSGGFFSALSDIFLSEGGVVYGAVWTDKFTVEHIRGTTEEERNLMRTSKYIQSDLTKVFKTIKQDVSSGKKVLFTGTPCQCTAIISLFGNEQPENLYIMDLICHGVLSQKFFDEYIEDVCERNDNKKIKTVNLRDKRYGWQDVGIYFTDNSVYHSNSDYFYKAYSMNSLQRSSCFSCVYATEKRSGDFTVGDFWGIRDFHEEFHDESGVSLVMINSEKGRMLFNIINTQAEIIGADKEHYLKYQPNLRIPTPRGERAEKFEKYYRNYGYKKTMHRFFDVTLQRRINSAIAKILRKIKSLK